MKSITNQITPAAIGALARGDIENAIVAMTPGGIEAQEAAGQAVLCAQEILPKDCPREHLEKMGVKFGNDHDDIFIKVTLPAGWKKQATDHSMWSDLLDDKGRVRAAIFYKAAFYDRNARLSLKTRYSVNSYRLCDKDGNELPDGKIGEYFKTSVVDGNEAIESFGVREKSNYSLSDEHENLAIAWLNEHFPQWEDKLAYWD